MNEGKALTPISVLITDDSALMRNLIGRIIENAEGLVVAGKAMNGRFALDKIPRLKPDVILLDIEMPEMNGIEFLKERQKLGIDVPVVILSSLAKRGAQITMDALALGASDFIMKPSGSISQDIHVVGQQIVDTVLAYGRRYRMRSGNVPVLPKEEPPVRKEEPSIRLVTEKKFTPTVIPAVSPRERDFPPAVPAEHRQRTSRVELVAMGISTGGPNALRRLFSIIDPGIKVPVVVVQHMPAGFTEEFAKSLGRVTALTVTEGAEGDLLVPGHVYIAPGHSHVTVKKQRDRATLHLSDADPVNGHRPSADVLFSSVAREYGKNCIGVIMTGMGRDGARHIGTLYNMGAITIGQNEESSVVYGMPKVAYEHGYIEYQLSIEGIADKLNSLTREFG
ncbi:MAG: chemotaxis response regulator protein-glutamate methylesterase [Spirochaetales bacterium]|nr:chemotaxis response regulator protein-glutamate methylesterase [Spirochaetales bacterium]